MRKVEIVNMVETASSTLKDLMYLAQEVSEGYFDKYCRLTDKDKPAIVYDFDRYRALYKIMYNDLLELKVELIEFCDRLDAEVKNLQEEI